MLRQLPKSHHGDSFEKELPIVNKAATNSDSVFSFSCVFCLLIFYFFLTQFLILFYTFSIPPPPLHCAGLMMQKWYSTMQRCWVWWWKTSPGLWLNVLLLQQTLLLVSCAPPLPPPPLFCCSGDCSYQFMEMDRHALVCIWWGLAVVVMFYLERGLFCGQNLCVILRAGMYSGLLHYYKVCWLTL